VLCPICVTTRVPVPEPKGSVDPAEDTVVNRIMPNVESTDNVTETPCNSPTHAAVVGSAGLSVPISVAVGTSFIERATLPVTLAAQGCGGNGAAR